MDEQNEPVMSGSTNATNGDKAQGIITQATADLAGQEEGTILEYLEQRFTESGVEYDRGWLQAAARRIAGSVPDDATG